mmetsp:Transcript_55729/g.169578  ORF Transcript_55729/g.169578 Transcript_55729/m.169578 type:complete len:205 (-) Transcript_55729:180-794(-)
MRHCWQRHGHWRHRHRGGRGTCGQHRCWRCGRVDDSAARANLGERGQVPEFRVRVGGVERRHNGRVGRRSPRRRGPGGGTGASPSRRPHRPRRRCGGCGDRHDGCFSGTGDVARGARSQWRLLVRARDSTLRGCGQRLLPCAGFGRRRPCVARGRRCGVAHGVVVGRARRMCGTSRCSQRNAGRDLGFATGRASGRLAGGPGIN